jgi:pre-mRNA-splicing helicase BRR2
VTKPTGKEADILEVDITEEPVYEPQTKESKAIYESILRIVTDNLGDKNDETLKDTANEVIALMKLDIKQDDKRKELSAIFKVNDATFTRLMNLTKEIKDYNIGKRASTSHGAQEKIMTLAFEEDDQGAIGMAEYANDAEDESYDAEVDQEGEEPQNMREEDPDFNRAHVELGMDIEEGPEKLEIGEVDRFWLTKKLEEIFNDPTDLKRKEELIMLTLNMDNEIDCQNRLVEIFDHSHFDFISVLHENRHLVYYMTKLTRASEEERKRILDDMRGDQYGREIYEKIQHMEQFLAKSEDHLSMNLMKEAQTLKKLVQENKREKEKLQSIQNNDEYARLTKTVLNLTELEFNQGSHFMANENCKLPKGSFKQSFSGYEEVYIPPKTQEKKHIALKKVEDMPAWTRSAFANMKSKTLNVIQSVVYECALKSAENMLICAPTGAGKTNIALLSILQQIGAYMDDKGHIDTSKFKIVYIAPMKALVSEIVGAFTTRLAGRFDSS